jgi:glyoxylase-like metal-dependent hydrolase (beta-lactamase superfamily II)
MLSVERYGDVERLLMWTRRSAAIGYHVSAYVTREVVVDTGFPGIGGEFGQWLETRSPRGVILTHAHEDHGGNVDIVSRLGLPLAMAPATVAELQAMRMPGLYRQITWGRPRRVPPRFTVRDVDEPALSLVHTPGHSADHHIVWDAEREMVFGGDLFLGVKVRALAPWESPRVHAASLRAVIALAPKKFFDAHRGLILDPLGVLSAKADWIDEKVGEIELRLAQGWSPPAIARAVLGRERALRYVSGGEYSYLNFVRAVVSPRDRALLQTPPT